MESLNLLFSSMETISLNKCKIIKCSVLLLFNILIILINKCVVCNYNRLCASVPVFLNQQSYSYTSYTYSKHKLHSVTGQ